MEQTGTRDQRRYPRLSTREAARFIYAGSSLACEIRNYCQTGFYLSFSDKSALDALLPELAGASARVEFGGDEEEGHRFLIDAHVAHLSEGGLGLYVEQMPEGALRLLQAVAARATAPLPSAYPGMDPAQGQSMQEECSGLLHTFLGAALQDFFSQAPSQLTEASFEESSFIERPRYVQGGQLLVQRRVQIQEDFFNALRERIQRIGQPEDASESAKRAMELSLIDEDEFQDWLNLSGAINEVELDVATQLAEFERRYSLLIGAQLERKRNPYAPELICRILQDAIQPLDFSNAMRAILYRAFARALAHHARSLYKQLNKVLAPLQPAPPIIRKSSDVTPDAPAQDQEDEANPENRPESRTDLAEIADTLINLFKQTQENQAGAMAAPENPEYSLDSILASLNQPGRRSAGQAGAPYAGAHPVAHTGSPGNQPSHSPLPHPNPLEMAGWLQQTRRQMGGGGPAQGGSDIAAGALPETGLRELLAALKSLPVPQPEPQGEAVREVPPGLSEQIQAWLAREGGTPKDVAPATRQALDMASSLIGRARAEYVASSEVELLIRRLERPLLKLALEDESFLITPDHPARQVVNLIDQYAIAADNKGKFFDPKLQRFLNLMVERICGQASADPGIFATARDSLAKALAPLRQARRGRVARLQEACEGRERIRQARIRVSDALAARLEGRQVPEPLLRLLEGGWRQYLVLLELREGMGGEEWNTGLAVLDRITGWLGEGRLTESDRLHEVRPLLNLIGLKLASVNVDSAQHGALMDDLAAALQAGADRKIKTLRYPALAKAAAPTGGGVDGAGQDRLAEELRVGEWWEFSQEGGWVPMQLIWLSQPPANCAFANRSASIKMDLSLPELSGQIHDGLARRGKNLELPLLDRSEFALFDDTYQGLLHQVLQDPVTGLDNRKGFLLKLGQAAAASARQGLVHSLCILEFDQFRLINNQCGPQVAEALSRKLADELRKLLRPVDLLSAFREDTFAIYLQNLGQVDGTKMAEDLVRRLGDYRFQHDHDSYSIGLNLGLAEYAPALVSAVEATKRADSACLSARSQGRNRMQAYEASNVQLQTQESLMDMAGRIDTLMESGGLYLRCQKVMPISVDTDLLPYYEILLGIRDVDGEEVRPMQFFPAVEGLKRAHEIDIWVMRKVFAWVRGNRDMFTSMGGFSINLSALSLGNSEVLAYIESELALADMPTEKIIFEITETAAIESYNAARDFMQRISRYGCRFSLDDFGSGYASYSHLKNLRTHSLKIDGSFVKDLAHSPTDFAMVKSMNDIGHSLGMMTVAEFVESPEILSKLREIGVDYAQGYVIHKPAPIEHLTSLD